VYHWDFGAVWVYHSLLLSGLGYTVLFTVICIFFGLLVGILAAMARLSSSVLISGPARAYVEIFRCTPLLVQLVWFYYAFPVLFHVEMTAVTASVISLSLYGGAFYSEIVRGGINAIDIGQVNAAKALGMTPTQSMIHVILPQAFKKMLPPLVSQSIMQLKNTSLLSVLAVPDLLYQAQSAAHDSYRPLELYTIVAVCYFAVLFPATLLAKRLEIRLARTAYH